MKPVAVRYKGRKVRTTAHAEQLWRERWGETVQQPSRARELINPGPSYGGVGFIEIEYVLIAVVKRIGLAPKSRNMRMIKDQPSRLSVSRLRDTGSSNCKSVDFLE